MERMCRLGLRPEHQGGWEESERWREEKLGGGVSYFAKSNDDHRNSKSWDGLAFGFGLAQSGITHIHKRFWVLLFYFSTYYTSTAGFVASANIFFVVLWVLCDSICT